MRISTSRSSRGWESDFETSMSREELGFINRKGRPRGGDALVVGIRQLKQMRQSAVLFTALTERVIQKATGAIMVPWGSLEMA
jgi:hypothetical protein